MVRFEGKSEEQIISTLKSWIKESEDYLKNYVKNWDIFWKLYDGFRKKQNSEDWRTNIFIPVIFGIIQVVLPRLLTGLLGEDAKFVIKARNTEKDKCIEPLKKVMDYYQDKSDLYFVFAEWIFDQLISDVAFIKVYQKYVERDMYWNEFVEEPVYADVPMMDPETGEPVLDPVTGEAVMEKMQTGTKPVMKEQKEKRVLYNGPFAETVDSRDVGFNPNSRDLDDSWTYHRYWKTIEEIENDPILGRDKAKVASLNSSEKESEKERLEREEGLASTKTKKIEIHEVHAGEYWFYLANRNTLLARRRPDKHGRSPLVSGTRYFKSRSIIGKSEVNPIHSMQAWVNDITNLRTDNLLISVMKMFFILDEDVDVDYLSMRPGGLIPAGKGGKPPVEIFEPGSIDFSAYKEIEMIQGHFNQASGAADYLGAPSGIGDINKTATGSNNILNEANKRAGLWIKLASKKPVPKVMYLYVALISQYCSEDELRKILGEQYDAYAATGALDWDPEDFDFETAGDLAEIFDERMLSALQNVYKIASQDPEAAQIIDKRELISSIVEKMKLNKEKLIKPMPTDPNEQMQEQNTDPKAALLEMLDKQQGNKQPMDPAVIRTKIDTAKLAREAGLI